MRQCTAEKAYFLYTKRADFNRIAQTFGIDPVTARILRNRDVVTDADIDLFLNGTLADLYDERLLPNIEAAAERLRAAVHGEKRIRVVGDYDIDGVCATYILVTGLARIGAKVDHRVPDRVKDGYGINQRIVEEAAAAGVAMILTCDNGIAAIEELQAAKELGLEVIVTDHHDVRQAEDGSELLPPADVIVSAKLKESRYPTTDICGAVTAWKLIRVLYRLCGVPDSEWLELLEFAAIATVGDVMPLRGENRIIVKEGLLAMNRGARNLGLRALIAACVLESRPISCYHIGFVLGPCINAGGRLKTAELALALFFAKTEEAAKRAAEQLKALNDERKYMTEQGAAEAAELVEKQYALDSVLVVYLPKLHESLAGIVAGRLKEQFWRPSFVFTDAEDGGLKGSGRSIEAYHMFNGLCQVAPLLTRFGGHPMAAGLSLPKENLEELRRQLNANAQLRAEDLKKKVWIDAAMPLSYVTEKLLNEFERLAPFGTGNEKPVFAEKEVQVTDLRVLGRDRNVLRMTLREPSGFAMAGIRFCDAEAERAALLKKSSVTVLYEPQINEFNGRKSLQAVVQDYF